MNLSEQQIQIQSIFDTAADHFDRPELPFWNIFGQRTVEKLQLQPSMKVLDLCCGSGASALPAAQAVGPTGSVTAHDLSENLLTLAKKKAEDLGLDNLNFSQADMNQLSYGSETFDAIQIVFGIFFSDDMVGTLKKLKPLLKPGGKIVITTWQEDAFEPINTIWKSELVKLLDDPFPKERPWDIVQHANGVRKVLEEAGFLNPEVISEDNWLPLAKPEDWWTMSLGSGYRAYIEMLDPNQRTKFRNWVIEELRSQGINKYKAGVHYGMSVQS